MQTKQNRSCLSLKLDCNRLGEISSRNCLEFFSKYLAYRAFCYLLGRDIFSIISANEYDTTKRYKKPISKKWFPLGLWKLDFKSNFVLVTSWTFSMVKLKRILHSSLTLLQRDAIFSSTVNKSIIVKSSNLSNCMISSR